MTFILTEADGDMHESSDLAEVDRLLASLAKADIEHGDISIRRPDGWTVSVFANGNVVLENVEARPSAPRHLNNVPNDEARRIMMLLAGGHTEALEEFPWDAGYPR